MSGKLHYCPLGSIRTGLLEVFDATRTCKGFSPTVREARFNVAGYRVRETHCTVRSRINWSFRSQLASPSFEERSNRRCDLRSSLERHHVRAVDDFQFRVG